MSLLLPDFLEWDEVLLLSHLVVNGLTGTSTTGLPLHVYLQVSHYLLLLSSSDFSDSSPD